MTIRHEQCASWVAKTTAAQSTQFCVGAVFAASRWQDKWSDFMCCPEAGSANFYAMVNATIGDPAANLGLIVVS